MNVTQEKGQTGLTRQSTLHLRHSACFQWKQFTFAFFNWKCQNYGIIRTKKESMIIMCMNNFILGFKNV